jgi:ribosomal protein S12 methylthiotransferase accessory factor
MTANADLDERAGDPLERAATLFEINALPAPGLPANFAIAFPGDALLALPGIPEAALPETGRMASGRGLDPAAARLSCLGEAAELFSCCAWGDEALVTATAAEIGPAAIPPDALNGFSRTQAERRTAWNRRYGGFDWQPSQTAPSRRLDWLSAKDAFTGKEVLVPADFAFIGRREAGDRRAVAIGDSNGCAAGADAHSAKLGALLELVERDATGRWWYGRRARPSSDPASDPAFADRAGPAGTLAAWLSERERRTRLFDITTDIGIPVIAAASAEPDGADVALGFSARLDPRAAALSAVTEMLQMEVSLETARLFGGVAGTWAAWRAEVTMATMPLAAAPQDLGSSPPRRGGEVARAKPETEIGTLAAALEELAAKDIDLCFVDMTRPEIGVPVMRAVSAALCHYKPRFGKARLAGSDSRDLGTPAFAEQPLLLI